MPLVRDLMHPTYEAERQRHKKKRLVQSPNSYFMDVRCPASEHIVHLEVKDQPEAVEQQQLRGKARKPQAMENRKMRDFRKTKKRKRTGHWQEEASNLQQGTSFCSAVASLSWALSSSSSTSWILRFSAATSPSACV
ncbi:hypothetical protein Z043_113034 [Scleropages formosus]|uniref:Uncharacterized protein n=1 Tax=Scleropages formosus TaxID=113540 RepID=A0A0P7UJ89_SCLFO|nr:hypothetical protein Z043_113034 [Scleropages formosus]